MSSPLDRAHQAIEVVSDLGHRSVVTFTDRLGRVRASLLLALQAGVAAGLAWYVAHNLIGHRAPFFAPISAVIVLGVSIGQRLRRAFELVLGVALGIGVGDLLIYAIGTGALQIVLVVVLAVLTAVFVGGSPTLIGQCASSAVLVATLAPPAGGIYYTRFVDALVGGAVGLIVIALLLLPLNPLTIVRRAAGPAIDLLATELAATAEALEARDTTAARAILDRIRASDATLTRFRDALLIGAETASLAPVRWRSRGSLAQYVDSATHIGRAVRNGRVLVRRAVAVLEDDEPITETLLGSLVKLSESARTLKQELASGAEPARTREIALGAVRLAANAYRDGLGFSGDVVVAQVRSIASDLLRASGVDDTSATRAVRRAVGRLTS